jgi:type I restriction enzyme M protein
MPSKRQVLDLLTRSELQDIAEKYELKVADRRKRDQLIASAAGSRKVVLSEILGSYSRDRLKELCGALRLDDSGKEKAALVGRLV